MEKERQSEFELMQKEIQKAKLGGILILPLRFQNKEAIMRYFETAGIKGRGIRTPDVTATIKAMFNPANESAFLHIYDLPARWLERRVPGDGCYYVRPRKEQMKTPDAACAFSFADAQFWLFPNVAFLCVWLYLSNAQQLDTIINHGHVESLSKYYSLRNGELEAFELEDVLLSALGEIGASPFYMDPAKHKTLFTEAVILALALFGEDAKKAFKEIETLRDISFSLIKMAALDKRIDDPALQDTRFVYGAKDPENGTHSWGCSTGLQGIGFVRNKAGASIEEGLTEQFEDTLPLALLALYQKFTCLSFAERVTEQHNDNGKKLLALQKDMLEFKAYGTVPIASISRWGNVQEIYRQLMETNGVPDAIESIDDKLKVLSERRNERRGGFENLLGWIVSIFGIMSMAESADILFTAIQEGNTLKIAVLSIVVLCPALLIAGVLMQNRLKWR